MEVVRVYGLPSGFLECYRDCRWRRGAIATREGPESNGTVFCCRGPWIRGPSPEGGAFIPAVGCAAAG